MIKEEIQREALEETLLNYLLPADLITAIADDVLVLHAPAFAEIARLQAKLNGVYAEHEQQHESLVSERRARAMAEADVAAYRRIIEVLNRAADVASVRGVAGTVLTTLRPGAALLAELDAARAYITYTHAAHRSDAAQVELWAAWHAAKKANTK